LVVDFDPRNERADPLYAAIAPSALRSVRFINAIAAMIGVTAIALTTAGVVISPANARCVVR
jgi:hypothetical protein